MASNSTYQDNTPTPFEVQRQLRRQLPPTWRLNLERPEGSRGPDAVLDLEAPDGRRTTILVEIKSRLDPVDVPRIQEQRETWAGRSMAGSAVAVLVAAPYLSERTRGRLRSAALNYLDLTGNSFLSIEEPAIYISSQGAEKNPNKSSRPVRSLRGAKTAQIVRALVDLRPPLGVRQIAEITKTDPGNVSRVLSLLQREDLVQRSAQGGVEQVNWAELLRAWSRDYSIMDSNKYFTYLAARGLGDLLARLRLLPENRRYAVTGSLVAARLAPVAPARLGIVFVEDSVGAAAALGLVPTESGANVMLVEPMGDFVFDRFRIDDGVRYVAPSQAVVDLLTGPGRNPSEAEELFEWMSRNEDAWRT